MVLCQKWVFMCQIQWAKKKINNQRPQLNHHIKYRTHTHSYVRAVYSTHAQKMKSKFSNANILFMHYNGSDDHFFVRFVTIMYVPIRAGTFEVDDFWLCTQTSNKCHHHCACSYIVQYNYTAIVCVCKLQVQCTRHLIVYRFIFPEFLYNFYILSTLLTYIFSFVSHFNQNKIMGKKALRRRFWMEIKSQSAHTHMCKRYEKSSLSLFYE